MKSEMIAMTLALLGVWTVAVDTTRAEKSRGPTTLKVPRGAGITAMASHAQARPGALVAVDVYLSNIDDLGAYQAMVTASGGSQGSLTIEDVQIQTIREDYVFGDDQIIDMVDRKPRTARAGAVSVEGGAVVDASPMYGATFYFRVSQDAKGTFTIEVEKGPAASMMTTSNAVVIPFEAGEPAAITIVTPRRTKSRME